ncbi:MAG: hypothetical protein U0353_21850 [Sandaracinus sp.]
MVSVIRTAIGRVPRAWLFVVLAVGVLLATTGCRSRRRTTFGSVPTVDARQVERLRRVGEHEMRCPRGSLVLVPMTQNAVELRGCDRIREYALVCRRGRRCNWQPMTPAALLATRDLGCPLEAMSVAAPSASTRDLVGCGRMGRYALSCVEDTVCRWNLLGPVSSDAAGAPPAAYGTGYAAPGSAPGPVPPPSSVPPSSSGQAEVPPPPGASLSVSGRAVSGQAVSGQVSVTAEVPPPPPGSTQPR